MSNNMLLHYLSPKSPGMLLMHIFIFSFGRDLQHFVFGIVVQFSALSLEAIKLQFHIRLLRILGHDTTLALHAAPILHVSCSKHFMQVSTGTLN